LPDARGRGSPPEPLAVVRSNRSATFRDSHFGRVLFLSAAANGYSSEWSGRLDLRRGIDSSCWSCRAWRWVVAIPSTKLGSSLSNSRVTLCLQMSRRSALKSGAYSRSKRLLGHDRTRMSLAPDLIR
jgi:hypothetical protein